MTFFLRIALVCLAGLIQGCGRWGYDQNNGDVDANQLAMDAAPNDARGAGVDYYVSPSGDDQDPGTMALPWATLQHAADTMVAGDRVLVGDGRYVGMTTTTSGQPSNAIVFKANGASVIIDQPGASGHHVRLLIASYIVVDGFTFENVSGRAIAVGGASAAQPIRGIVLRGNQVAWTPGSAITLSHTTDSLIEGNVIEAAGNKGISLGGGASDNNIIRRNILRNAADNGLFVDGDLAAGGDGIISGLRVEKNIVSGSGVHGIGLDGVQDSLFINNLVVDSGASAFRGYRIDGAEGPSDLIFVNNTIDIFGGGDWCIKLSDGGAGNVIFNNILMNDGGSGAGSVSIDATIGLQSANNAVAQRFSIDNDSSTISLTQWQAMGYETASIEAIASELFFGRPDYHLQPTAIVLGQGRANFQGALAPTDDIEGTPRIAGNLDLGAYQR